VHFFEKTVLQSKKNAQATSKIEYIAANFLFVLILVSDFTLHVYQQQ
jgi:hypothetical protein